MDLSFGVAGPGRVGMSLAKAFAAAGLSCAGVYGGTHAKARAAELGVRHFNEPLGLVAAADVIFICVPDRFINEAAESMAKAAAQAGLDVSGKYFYHVSGSAGLDELAPLKALGAETGSLHPLQSFAAPVKSLAGIGMAVDGSAKAQELGFKLARLSGAAAFKVPQKERALYHAAACFCSNFTVTVTALAEKLLLRWTEDEETAHRLLVPLLAGTAANLASAENAGAALTGPISRGDAVTVAGHLKVLPQEFVPAYCALGLATVKLARESGCITESAAAEMTELFTEANK